MGVAWVKVYMAHAHLGAQFMQGAAHTGWTDGEDTMREREREREREQPATLTATVD